MGCNPQGGGVIVRPAMVWGPFSRIGASAALAVCALDQAIKLWLLFVYRLGERGRVNLMPSIDLVLTWNKGISYGMFQQSEAAGQWALVAIKVIAVVLLGIWLSRATGRLMALSLGLIIGGALGNGIDRAAYGAVADFVLFYVNTLDFKFSWYVFNLADAAIVAGVAGLLYDSLLGGSAAKTP